MIRKLALLAGAAFLAKKLIDRSRPLQGSSQPSTGHVPVDLLGERHPDGTVRAEDHYRPDATAPVPPEDRESLRPVTAPAPHDPPGR